MISSEKIVQTKEVVLSLVHKHFQYRTPYESDIEIKIGSDQFDYQAERLNYMTRDLVHNLRVTFAEERIKKVKIRGIGKYQMPKNWFEYFKYQYAPKWYLKRFLAKFNELLTEFIDTIDLSFVYPALELPKIKPGVHPVFFGLVRKDEEGGETYE